MARYPSSQEKIERHNAIVEGAFVGSLEWWRYGNAVALHTFLEVSYKADTDKLVYNNEVEPAVGAKFTVAVSDGIEVEAGVKLVHEYRFRSRRSESGTIVFLGWSASW